jgi:hypothetical protein
MGASVREDGASAARAKAGCWYVWETAYDAAPGRGFALRMVYGSVAAGRGAPYEQEVCDSLEETCARGQRKRITPVWVHQRES